MERETVRPVQSRGDDFGLAFPVLVDDRIDLVENAVADEHGSLVAESERPRVRDPARIDFDLEALGQLELRDRQLVFRRPERQGRDVAQLLGDFGVGNVGPSRHGRWLRLQRGYRFWRLRRRRRRGRLSRRFVT